MLDHIEQHLRETIGYPLPHPLGFYLGKDLKAAGDTGETSSDRMRAFRTDVMETMSPEHLNDWQRGILFEAACQMGSKSIYEILHNFARLAALLTDLHRAAD